MADLIIGLALLAAGTVLVSAVGVAIAAAVCYWMDLAWRKQPENDDE